MTEEEDRLHLRAYSAIMGVGPLTWLAELLRSDHEISPHIREQLANAVDPGVPTPSEAKLIVKAPAHRPIKWGHRLETANRKILAIDLLSELLSAGWKEDAAVHDVYQKFGFRAQEIREWRTAGKKIEAEHRSKNK